ncbi:MAG: RDD family protein [Candidatus Omnitrophica bacterium]|nr:RDD family protein [Candidatus Omnitrophota bacterium]
MADVVGGGAGLTLASKGKRIASDVVDLLFIPIVIGFVIAFLLLAAAEPVRNTVLIIVNVVWMLFRDLVFSPGRKMVGIKLASLSGEKITPAQAVIRNILLIIPFVLLVGYILETIMILVKGERLEDGWAKARVVNA